MYNFEICAKIISVFPGCMVKIFTKIKYFQKRKPEREQLKNLGAPRSLTLRAKTAAPAHAHAPLRSKTLIAAIKYVKS